MYEFIEVVLVALAKINECLDGLVWVSRNVLFSAFINDLKYVRMNPEHGTLHTNLYHIVDENSKVCDAVVYIGRLVHTNQRLVEDREEITQ